MRVRRGATILPQAPPEETTMVSTTTPPGAAGWPAAPFDLPGTDGRRHTLASVRGPNGLVVMFICNHCPYVKAVIDRIARDMADLAALGVGSVAIMSNDPAAYEEDSFENMKAVAVRHGFGFPYVLDETQAVAKAYGAVCTPDFFGFDRDMKLAYRGRLDASGRSPNPGAPPSAAGLAFSPRVHAANAAADSALRASTGCAAARNASGSL
jgi:peroxiredoxin